MRLLLPISINHDGICEPDYIEVEVTPGQLEKIKRTVEVVKECGAYRMSFFDGIKGAYDEDYDAETEDSGPIYKRSDFRTECTTLNVTDNDCYWSGLIKHTDTRWESSSVPIEALVGDVLDLRGTE